MRLWIVTDPATALPNPPFPSECAVFVTAEACDEAVRIATGMTYEELDRSRSAYHGWDDEKCLRGLSVPERDALANRYDDAWDDIRVYVVDVDDELLQRGRRSQEKPATSVPGEPRTPTSPGF